MRAPGADNALDGAMAKLYISETSVQSALDACDPHPPQSDRVVGSGYL
jgi:hypothetical protein